MHFVQCWFFQCCHCLEDKRDWGLFAHRAYVPRMKEKRKGRAGNNSQLQGVVWHAGLADLCSETHPVSHCIALQVDITHNNQHTYHTHTHTHTHTHMQQYTHTWYRYIRQHTYTHTHSHIKTIHTTHRRMIWNSLPLSVRHSSSLSSFKSKLKTHFFSSAYWSVVLPIYHQ